MIRCDWIEPDQVLAINTLSGVANVSSDCAIKCKVYSDSLLHIVHCTMHIIDMNSEGGHPQVSEANLMLSVHTKATRVDSI